VTVRYLDLTDYVAIAEEVTGLDGTTVLRVANLDLADSALHAPAAGFGQSDLYPDFVDKASVLMVRLAKNHPLPDGNKRVAWVAMRYFVMLNEWTWVDSPSIDDAEQAVVAVASGIWGEAEFAAWLRPRLVGHQGLEP
jgi:death-on-curing protein